MGFSESVYTCYKKSFTYVGCASRSEYWWFVLYFALAIPTIGFLIDGYNELFNLDKKNGEWLLDLFIVANSPAIICGAIRRLHDVDKPGAWLILGLLPIPFLHAILLLVVLVFLLKPTKRDSEYRITYDDPIMQRKIADMVKERLKSMTGSEFNDSKEDTKIHIANQSIDNANLCPYCGKPIDYNWGKYCKYCGRPLTNS